MTHTNIVHPRGTGLALEDALDIRGMSLPFFIGMIVGLQGIIAGSYLHLWFLLVLIPIQYSYRMFFVTGYYHRYFSHKTFRWTHWFFEGMAGILTLTTWQRSPLKWGVDHRVHHRYSDKLEDVHSFAIAYDYVRNTLKWNRINSLIHAFGWSHMFWITSKENAGYKADNQAKELEKNPLLRVTEMPLVALVVPLLEMVCIGFVGVFYYDGFSPSLWTLNTFLLTAFVAYGGSVFCVWHGTFAINSVAHLAGVQVYPKTKDKSKNSWWLAILTFGEGWHNNHHAFQGFASQALSRKQYMLDWSFWTLCIHKNLGLVDHLTAGVHECDKEWFTTGWRAWFTRGCSITTIAS